MENENAIRIPRPLRELHLFAGAGGGILGGILLGHTCVCAVEIEPYCRKVLLQRQRDGILPKFPIWDDVRTFNGKPWRGKVDVVAGGFPCTDISAAGRGAGITGQQSGLWTEMERIIGEVQPPIVLVENSPLLISRGLGLVLSGFAKMGYDARWGIVGADNVAAPHRRKRIWILAYTRLYRGGPREHEAIATEPAKVGNHRPILANAELARLQGREHQQGIHDKSGNGTPDESIQGSCDVANSASERSSGSWREWFGSDPAEIGEGETDQSFAERGRELWGIESRVGRVAHGVANRMDRLKAIGNGQVPSVVRLAWNALSS